MKSAAGSGLRDFYSESKRNRDKEECSLKRYLKKNAIPIIWEGIFIVSCFLIPGQYYLYTNFVFYLGIVIYFLCIKEISFKKWRENITSGKAFWKPVGITALCLIFAFVFTGVLESVFSNFATGTIGLVRDTWGKLFLFAVSTIILPPLAEEMFYRSSMICMESKKTTYLTLVFSMLLYALEHDLKPFGILLTMIWALPFSVSYIKTKNIYIPMTAHFLVNLTGNGADVIITAINWL